MKYFLVGIKGSGMSALANILLDMGHEVSGVDVGNYVYTQDLLLKRNVIINTFNDKINYDYDYLIYGHSFKNYKIVETARNLNVKVYEYHEFISILLENKISISICGSHGKTSSVGLLTCMLDKYNPSYLRGDGKGKWTDSKLFIFEACEYQEHFLKYDPDYIILLNIDYDHVDYFKDEKTYYEAFEKYLKKARKHVYFHNSLKLKNNAKNKYKLDFNVSHFNLIYKNEKLLNNLYLLIKFCLDFKVNKDDINNGIISFKGVDRRRVETIINDDIIVDDYAHHPSQMEVMIDEYHSLYKDKSIVAIYKPDRYSRLYYFKDKYRKVLSTADECYILPFNEDSINDTSIDFDASILGFKVLDESFLLEKLSTKRNTVFLFFSSKDLTLLLTKLKVKLTILK